MRVSLLTGADDATYAIPLAASLADQGIQVEFIGNDEMATSSRLSRANIHYVNLRGNQDPRAPIHTKIARVLRYYRDLIRYTSRTDARVFHILWLNKFELLDRTILNVFYKLCGKRLVFTAHNVNARKRDANDTWVNRATLRAMYWIVDHIFVHTDVSKDELVRDFRVAPAKVTVIPFGLNIHVPDTPLTKGEARTLLGLAPADEVLLFFGQIAPYKGLDLLVDALEMLAPHRLGCRLIVAGRAKAGADPYWRPLKARLERAPLRPWTLVKDGFIPDDEVPILFRAADVLVLPYRAIYQSGPLSLAFRFGIPVIATRVGSFGHDVVPGVTGLLCEPEDPRDLARAIGEYFESELYREGDQAGKRIREIASEKYSWEGISRAIVEVYAQL